MARCASVASVAALMIATAIAAASDASSAAPPPGVTAVLHSAAPRAAQPQRALLLGVTRAGARLVAVGEHGVIILSDDHGRRWRQATTVPIDATLAAVRFADANVGWAVGHLGVVLHTDDGGEHWKRQLDGEALVQLAITQARASGRSDDQADARRLADDGPDKPLLDLLVDDTQRLTVIGAFNLALHSVDGGTHWQVVSRRFDNPGGLHLYGIAQGPSGVFAVGEQALLLKQAGDNFKLLKSPYDGSLFGVLPTGPDSLLIYGLRGHAYVSFDGGTSWSAAQLPGSGASLNGALRLSDGRVLLCDQAGKLFVSTDGGARFTSPGFAWGAPLTGLAEAADGSVVATSLAGIVSIPAAALAASLRQAGTSEPAR